MEKKNTKGSVIFGFITIMIGISLFINGVTTMYFIGSAVIFVGIISLFSGIKRTQEEYDQKHNKSNCDDFSKYNINKDDFDLSKDDQFTKTDAKKATTINKTTKVDNSVSASLKNEPITLEKVIADSDVIDESDWLDSFNKRLNSTYDFSDTENITENIE